MKRYTFLDERKFRFLCEGLTLDAHDMEVLDSVLVGLEETHHTPSRIVEHSSRNGFGRPPKFEGPQVIVNLDKKMDSKGQMLRMAPVVLNKDSPGRAPALHINLRSPLLDIPQRIEIPLRFVLKGLPSFDDTYMVYLHALKLEDGRDMVYYGITRRGWMKRFNEHMRDAMSYDSPYLFHQVLRESCIGRAQQLHGASVQEPAEGPPAKVLVGNYHVLCAAGLTKDQAEATEEHLVSKYSLGHADGLNTIPGGKAGIAYLHKLRVLHPGHTLADSEDRQRALITYLREHPRKGVSNQLVAQRWLDPDYATRVICSGKGRLSPEQVRTIRAAALAGQGVEEIRQLVSADEKGQVQRVLDRKTYTRVQ